MIQYKPIRFSRTAGLFIFLVICSSINLVAQTINVTAYDVDQGLSNSSIADILTDKYGYKWISTGHGLNRFDGLSFETFRHDPRDTLSVRANSQGRLFQDRDANIWVTIDIGGICMFNRVSKKFYYFNYDPDAPGHPNSFVNDALFDRKGRAWIGTNTGINLINHKTRRFEPISIDSFDELTVRGIYEDGNGAIWLGTTKGFFKFDEPTQQFVEVKDSGGNTIFDVRRFMEDQQGNFWIATRNNVLYRLGDDQNQPTIIPLSIDPGQWISNLIQTRNSGLIVVIGRRGLLEWKNEQWEEYKIDGLESMQLSFAYSDCLNDKVFINTFDNRVFLYNQLTGQTSNIPNFNKPLVAFELEENGENLWLGTQNFGLYQVNEKRSLFDHIVIKEHPGSDVNYANFVTNLLETKDGNTYFVAGAGLFQVDKETNKISHTIDYWRRGDFNIGINSIEELDNENLLLTTQRGIFKFNRKTKEVSRFHPLEERVFDLTIYKDELWAIGNFGLLVYDLKKKTTRMFRDMKMAPGVLTSHMPRKLFIDSEGIVWVGTVREGLYRVERHEDEFLFNQYKYTGIWKSDFLSQSINAIFEDNAGRLWIGGFSSGLLEFDRENRRFINYTPEGELPIPNVQAIEQATDGCLWLSAADGLHKFIPNSGTFKKYTTRDGLISNSYVLRSSSRTADGQILFGSNKGITIFDPLKTDLDKPVPKVQIEDITSLNQRLNLDQPIFETASLDLRYSQNSVSIQFIALDFTDVNRISYAYRLQGLNDDWVHLGPNRNVSLTNLRPGSYNFEVRATFNKGAWSETKALLIDVKAPFWLKSWFFGLVAITILIGLWVVYRFRLNQKLHKIRFLEEVRQKAAADFHDEMGNKLTRIALFTDVLKQKLNGTTNEVSEYVDKIRDNSRNLNSSMRDFLWALDPKKDTAYDLAVLLKDFGEDLFDKTNVEFRIECIESNLQLYKLDMDWKRNLIMIFKEAMHNVLKHAKATQVSLGFVLQEDEVQILLTDNGKGLDEEKKVGGYGIRNMNYRSDQLGGKLTIEESVKSGTFVEFIGNLKKFSIA